MFNTEDSKRTLALVITHYAYRNTVLENYHAENTKMDMEFYKKIYKVVYTNLKKVALYNKYTYKLPDGQHATKAQLDEILKEVPQKHLFKFLNYFRTIINTIDYKFGSAWDKAQELPCDLNGKSPARYVLEGHFLECCQAGAFLDDQTMCYINKDVHNRIYTLLVNGVFD